MKSTPLWLGASRVPMQRPMGQSTRRAPTARLALLASALALTACANYSGIAPTAKALELAALGTPTEWAQWPTQQWWQQYGDSTLNALEQQALAGNAGLQQAQARVARAQAALQGTDANGMPRASLGLESTRELFTKNGLYPPPLAGAIFSNNNAQLSASYELDFWDKNAAAVRAGTGQVQAAQAEVAAAQSMLAANVARTYFGLARLLAQREVSLATLQQRQRVLALVQQRVQAGLDTKVELRQAESGLPVGRGDVAVLDEQIGLTRNALAALLGAGPQTTANLVPQLAQVQLPVLPSALPAQLLARRADIAAAKARVQAAVSETEVAKAQFYPNVNLSAFAGLSSLGTARWLQSGSETWGVGPAISLPIFDAGRLRANLGAKTAEIDAAIASYNQTVVGAAQDVADQVASAQSVAVQSREQSAAQAAAQAGYDLAVQRYQAGISPYLSVLASENAVLAQRRAATDLAARALEVSVNLNRALGGGYETPPLVTALTVQAARTAHPQAQ